MYEHVKKYALRSDFPISLCSKLQAHAAKKYAQGESIEDIALHCFVSEDDIRDALAAAGYIIAAEITLRENDGDDFISFPLKRQDYYLLLSALDTVQKDYFFNHCPSDDDPDWQDDLDVEIKKLCKLYELLQSGLFRKVIHPGILSWEPEDFPAIDAYCPAIFPTISITDWMQDS